MSTLACPHCQAEQPNHWEFDESGVIECFKCERRFRYKRQRAVTYEVETGDSTLPASLRPVTALITAGTADGA